MTYGPGLDLFAGPGGWDEGARLLGIHDDIMGVEWDEQACATATAAGHHRMQLDVSKVNITDGRRYRFTVNSPVCRGFSFAGKGVGRQDAEVLVAAAAMYRRGREWSKVNPIAWAASRTRDPRSALSLEPLRYVVEMAALGNFVEWTAFEQVAAVGPLWDVCVEVLRTWGYDAHASIVHAEQYGVPQARKRAVLRATRRTEGLRPLVPTHSRYHRQAPDRLDEDVRPWVSAGQALIKALGPGWTPTPAISGEGPDDVDWVFRRPAPTIVGSFHPEVLSKPAYRNAGDPSRQNQPGSMLMTLQEAAVLQTFPVDYPWQGSTAQRWRQVGDAVPPRMAAAIITSLM